MKKKLICMSFDGEFQTENPEFDTVDEAWNHSGEMGSRWYFYPFHFVTNGSQSIVDAPELFRWTIGKRIKTVSREFQIQSEKPENEDLDIEGFAFSF